jgi:uncharacterized protein (TIGR02186 family)
MRGFKIQDSKFKILILLIFGFLTLNLAFSGDALASLTAETNHDHIKIGFFYHGSTVDISGFSNPADADLIVKITSPEGPQKFRKKVKAAGLLWMNDGELKFEHAPSLYFLYSTRKLDDILSQEEMDKYVIGYSALNGHMEITPVANEDEKTKFFNEFVKFKESSHLYSISSSSQKISTTDKDGKQTYFIELNWPYQASPDNYLVTVYAVKDKKVIEKAEANMLVEQVGIVKTLYNMAKNNGALYGLLSIFAALVAGFIVAIVFPKKGKGGH